MDFDKREKTIVLVLALFSAIWCIFIMPTFMSSEWFTTLVPPFQYILFNLGFLVVFILIAGFPISYFVNGKEIKIKDSLRWGFGLWLGSSMIIDLWNPPYYIDINGNSLFTSVNPSALMGTAIDTVMVWIWRNIGISGPALFYLTYLFTPIIAALFLACVLAPRQFIGLFASVKGKGRRK